jgi:hypothetical protein
LHENTLEQIGPYLKGTIDKGVMLRLGGLLNIDCYMDTDFAGLWSFKDNNDPSCVKRQMDLLSALQIVQ